LGGEKKKTEPGEFVATKVELNRTPTRNRGRRN